MHQQINQYFESLLSPFTQRCLLVMVEKMKKIGDNKEVFAAVLTDLFKAFDCILHGLLIAKLNAFGFDKKSLSFISADLYNRKQKTKVSSEFSDFLNTLSDVPQGSILRPLYLLYLWQIYFLLTMTLILPVMQIIPLPTFVDRIFLKL